MLIEFGGLSRLWIVNIAVYRHESYSSSSAICLSFPCFCLGDDVACKDRCGLKLL